MNGIRFSLAKKGKAICPKCERKTFVLYIDNTTGKPVHSTVGKCDRADNCGHHYTPKQYFTDNHISFDTEKSYVPHPTAKPAPKPQPSFIDEELLEKSLSGYENNRLVQYLRNLVGCEAADRAIKRYRVGTSKRCDGAAVFWQIDMNGKIHAGKIIVYGTDGHRRKEIKPPVQWVHTVKQLSDFHLSQCFFGEHLLIDKNKPVAIVESEKTAIIASIYLPEYIWLACGGSEGLSAEKCAVLKGRNVILYPDAGQYDKWNEKAKTLSAICTVSVSSLIEEQATEAERKAGFDLADYLVKFSLSDFAEPKHGKQYPAYVSDEGTLYIPTPPDGQTACTVRESIEAYNSRQGTVSFVPMQSVDISGMRRVFVNLDRLKITD